MNVVVYENRAATNEKFRSSICTQPMVPTFLLWSAYQQPIKIEMLIKSENRKLLYYQSHILFHQNLFVNILAVVF